MTEMIKLFCDNKIGIDITGMSVTDPQTVELISVLKEHTRLDSDYTKSIENYFKELEDQKWEVLICDANNTLNAYRGNLAEHYRTDHQICTIKEFLGKQIDIEESTFMEMFN